MKSLIVARSSNLAIEALAGLASVEDFKSVNLKSSSLPLNQSWLPYTAIMLLHIKGRTHIQTRLVEPTYTSINRGDCFVLIANNKLYRFVGCYANVIEKSRSKNICSWILENKDMGCTWSTGGMEIVINDGKANNARHVADFWRALGKPDGSEFLVTDAGHADEDDLFESCLIETNMIYEYQDEQLYPVEKYWGSLLKVEMLEPHKVLVFNFGSEVYVWNGKNARSDAKRGALRLAQELFSTSYDYEMCELNPFNYTQIAGDRTSSAVRNHVKSAGSKPDWCILAKITQHMETILFREKFIDWPEYERDDVEKEYRLNGGVRIKALNGAQLYAGEPYEEPNLILENANLGRGNFYYDTDTMRHYDILTQSKQKWQINEFNFSEINANTWQHFYSNESYIVRWMYQISVTVRELTGQISKRNTVGRDRCVYFCWQGTDSSANEKGAAALLTVELDKEKGSQIRVSQGDEPSAFVRLFKAMFVHRGRKEEAQQRHCRLFILTGNDASEQLITEVNCSIENLRSRASMLLVNQTTSKLYLWHGCKSLQRELALSTAKDVQKNHVNELFTSSTNVSLEELEEGTESDEFFVTVGGNTRTDYFTLLNSDQSYDFTPRLFHFSSTNGHMEALEILSQAR